jgi:hypothetical protein
MLEKQQVRYDFLSPYGTIMVRFALKMPSNWPFRRYQVEFPFGRLPVHSTVYWLDTLQSPRPAMPPAALVPALAGSQTLVTVAGAVHYRYHHHDVSLLRPAGGRLDLGALASGTTFTFPDFWSGIYKYSTTGNPIIA